MGVLDPLVEMSRTMIHAASSPGHTAYRSISYTLGSQTWLSSSRWSVRLRLVVPLLTK